MLRKKSPWALYVKNRIRVPGIPPIVYEIAHIGTAKGSFFRTADALVYPYPKLIKALEIPETRSCPFVERIATYATAQDILRRTPEELANLRQQKLGIVYMGWRAATPRYSPEYVKGHAAGHDRGGTKARRQNIDLDYRILGIGPEKTAAKGMPSRQRRCSAK